MAVPVPEGIGDPASGVDRSAKPVEAPPAGEAGGFSIVAMNIDRIGIVGTGLAGLRAAAELREAGFAGSLVAWDAEGRPPYDRPPLSKSLFDNPIRPLADQGLGDLASLDVDVIPRPVERLRRRNGAWFVDETPVDAAIVASGSSPRVAVPGAFALHTAADALRLADSLAPGVRLDVVGAGWVGTELASVASAVCEVHLWESSSRILGRTFGGAVDDLWSGWLDDAGVSLHLGQEWPIDGESAEGSQSGPTEGPASSAGQTPRPHNRPSSAERRVLVQAVGAAPSFPAIEPAVDVSVRGALVTDMWTRVLRNGRPVEGLYAVGDCADALTPHGPRKGGHWTKALTDGAFTAAAVCRGKPPRFLAPPEVFSAQFGRQIGFVGAIPGLADDIPGRADGARSPADGASDGPSPSLEDPSGVGDVPDAEGLLCGKRIDTAEGLVIRWEKEGELAALLAIDSPRELSRARKTLRVKL